MRSFWLSLLLFVLLLCSCKTKEVAREINSNERFTSDISALNEKTKVDTTKTKKVEKTKEYTRIIERETITEYDTEKQTPSKVTEKEKVIEQGIKTKTDETENRGIADASKDSTYLFRDDTKMVVTNADRIRNMTDEELAELLVEANTLVRCKDCTEPMNEWGSCIGNCENAYLKWLKEKVE